MGHGGRRALLGRYRHAYDRGEARALINHVPHDHEVRQCVEALQRDALNRDEDVEESVGVPLIDEQHHDAEPEEAWPRHNQHRRGAPRGGRENREERGNQSVNSPRRKLAVRVEAHEADLDPVVGDGNGNHLARRLAHMRQGQGHRGGLPRPVQPQNRGNHPVQPLSHWGKAHREACR